MVTAKQFVVGGVSVLLGGGATYYLLRSRLANAASPFPGGTPPANTPPPKPQSPGETVGSAGDPPALNDAAWGNVPAAVQKVLIEVQNIARIPFFWVYGSIAAQGESGFDPTAQNNDKKEVDASTDAIAAGTKRGNPMPLWGEELGAFGSGGYYASLAPYFAWSGLDEGYMPFLNRAPKLIFDPYAATVFAAHYFWRITSPNYAKGRKLNLYDVRVGWSSPSVLKNDPFGKSAQGTRGRMDESIQVIGWDRDWVASLPIVRDSYVGINVVAKHFGFTPDQKDKRG